MGGGALTTSPGPHQHVTALSNLKCHRPRVHRSASAPIPRPCASDSRLVATVYPPPRQYPVVATGFSRCFRIWHASTGHTTAQPSSTGDCPARGCGRRGSPSASAPDGIGCGLSAPRAPANPRPRSGTSAGSGRRCRPGRSLCAALVSDGTLATCSLRIPAFRSSPEGLIADFSTGTGQRCPWSSCFPRAPRSASGPGACFL